MDERRDYYENLFGASLDATWEKAPGKDVIIAALKQCHLAPGAEVIDVGCGTGFLLSRIRDEVDPGWGLTGVDFSSQAIARGKARYPYLKLFCADGTRMPFGPDTFDALISYGTYEHFTSPGAGIAEAARVLKPGGSFFMMLPSLGIDRTDRSDEGWYEEREVPGSPVRQLQWNLKRETWAAFFTQADLELFAEGVSGRFGALKPGVFYFGKKPKRPSRGGGAR